MSRRGGAIGEHGAVSIQQVEDLTSVRSLLGREHGVVQTVTGPIGIPTRSDPGITRFDELHAQDRPDGRPRDTHGFPGTENRHGWSTATEIPIRVEMTGAD